MFQVSPARNAPSPVAVAAGPKDHFVVVWEGEAPVRTLLGQRLVWARPGDDPCLFGGGSFVCDAAHDGGTAELTLPLDLKPRDVVLLGDVDGDGDEDPCVYRNNRFLCNTTRDGKEDLTVAFGRPGLLPVLGNVDGI